MTNYARREIARRETQAKFPVLIKIESEDLGNYYYVNSDQNIVYDGNEYLGAVFSIDPPDKDGSRIGDAQLTFSVVGQEWIYRIRSTQKPAKLHFMACIQYDNYGNVQLEKLEENSFTLRLASWNDVAVSWNMVFDENMAIMLPSEDCNAITCPGCA